MRVGVTPRADQALADPWMVLDEAKDRVAVAVGPSSHHEDRASDRSVVLADRALLPVVIATLVLEPLVCERNGVPEPIQPDRPPSLADDLRVRWARVIREHRASPRQHVPGEHASA